MKEGLGRVGVGRWLGAQERVGKEGEGKEGWGRGKKVV